MPKFLVVAAVLAGSAAALPAGLRTEVPASVAAATVVENAAIRHPADYLTLGSRLFREGHKDEGVFWFYVGQLRYRALIAARPTLSPIGAPATFASMVERLGPVIDNYAFGDTTALAKTVAEVLAWDDANPDPFTPKDRFAADRDIVRRGFESFRDRLIETRDEIRTKRARIGLLNR